jgi:aspartokinase
MSKIKIHNLLCAPGQVLLNIQMHESKLIYLPPILATFREEGISIPFIMHSFFPPKLITITLTLDQKDMAIGQVAFQEGLDISPPEFLKIKRKVVLIIIYGPHLGEIPGVVSRLHKLLSQEGVEILAMSASLNSCLLVIQDLFLPKANRAFAQIFEIPQG